jgi:hypothetical protein
MRKPLRSHVAVDVAAQLAADADTGMLPRLCRLRGVAGAQTRLPKPLNIPRGRRKKEKMRTRKSTKRSMWNLRLSSSKCHHCHHHCLTSLRLWPLRLNECNS